MAGMPNRWLSLSHTLLRLFRILIKPRWEVEIKIGAIEAIDLPSHLKSTKLVAYIYFILLESLGDNRAKAGNGHLLLQFSYHILVRLFIWNLHN